MVIWASKEQGISRERSNSIVTSGGWRDDYRRVVDSSYRDISAM
jgi:hypothetical protein